ncbi:MAG TPA: transposase family protein, partial [Candidatus Babeliales bacterium]|nr:transposase family protein [Candidatus Babeliales bacterium]
FSKGRIVHVSKPKQGSVHDFELHKTEPPIPKNTRAFVNSGYQGLDKLHHEIELPYKATKTKPLDAEEKEYNKALSRIRVKVENIIRDIKTFRILSDRYHNKRKWYNVKFNIIAGIVNLKNDFESV